MLNYAFLPNSYCPNLQHDPECPSFFTVYFVLLFNIKSFSFNRLLPSCEAFLLRIIADKVIYKLMVLCCFPLKTKSAPFAKLFKQATLFQCFSNCAIMECNMLNEV